MLFRYIWDQSRAHFACPNPTKKTVDSPDVFRGERFLQPPIVIAQFKIPKITHQCSFRSSGKGWSLLRQFSSRTFRGFTTQIGDRYNETILKKRRRSTRNNTILVNYGPHKIPPRCIWYIQDDLSNRRWNMSPN